MQVVDLVVRVVLVDENYDVDCDDVEDAWGVLDELLLVDHLDYLELRVELPHQDNNELDHLHLDHLTLHLLHHLE